MATYRRKVKHSRELRAIWRRRLAVYRSQYPRSFAEMARRIFDFDREALAKLVGYGSWLYQTEYLRMIARLTAIIGNGAKSAFANVYYAWIVHEGHPGKSAPTMIGKKWYAWTLEGYPRPRDLKGWKTAERLGVARRSKRYHPFVAKPWRTTMLNRARAAMRQSFRHVLAIVWYA